MMRMCGPPLRNWVSPISWLSPSISISFVASCQVCLSVLNRLPSKEFAGRLLAGLKRQALKAVRRLSHAQIQGWRFATQSQDQGKWKGHRASQRWVLCCDGPAEPNELDSGSSGGLLG